MHFDEWLGAGIFFLGLAVTQTLGAFALVVIPGRLTYAAIAVMNLGTVLVWAMSRSIGMPIGPEAGQPASVGMPDLVATVFELLSVLAVLTLLLQSRPSGQRAARLGQMSPRAYVAMGSIPLYILILTFVAVVPAAAGHGTHSDGGSHDHASHSHG